jgi:hypothetical protein
MDYYAVMRVSPGALERYPSLATTHERLFRFDEILPPVIPIEDHGRPTGLRVTETSTFVVMGPLIDGDSGLDPIARVHRITHEDE